ncbi:DUF1963 domain-containing protein [bacterium]|jgi:uncharacterized protein YwqG|nr:DUF1963 domain-containing protein [bacterium]
MQISEIKDKLRKKAVVFQTGGARPENNIFRQSWIGKVKLGYTEEACPIDVNQQPMFPLMQLCLADLPFIPKALQNTKVLTVFISSDFLDDEEGNFCIREYSNLEDLVEKDFGNSIEGVKPFPLFPQLIENDFPAWEDGDDISSDVADIILLREKGIEYREDIYEEKEAMHKIGGYANYCRGDHAIFKAGNEFLLQIATDYKAGLEIGQAGNIYFAKNLITNEWQALWDAY